MKWYIKAMKNYFNIGGRAQRAEFWYFTLFYMIGSIALGYADYSLGLVDKENKIGLLSLIFALAHFVPSITVAIRRLHDIGRRGWWMLMVILVPIIGFIAFLILMAQNSDGDNTFGDSPKGYSEEKKGSIFMSLLTAILAVGLLAGAAFYKFGPMIQMLVMEKIGSANGMQSMDGSSGTQDGSFDTQDGNINFSFSTNSENQKNTAGTPSALENKTDGKLSKINKMDEELRIAQEKIDREFKESQVKMEKEAILKEKGLSPLDFNIAKEKEEAKKRLDAEYKKAMTEMN